MTGRERPGADEDELARRERSYVGASRRDATLRVSDLNAMISELAEITVADPIVTRPEGLVCVGDDYLWLREGSPPSSTPRGGSGSGAKARTMRASKLCNEPGCPELIPGSVSAAYCPAHLPATAHGWGSSTELVPSRGDASGLRSSPGPVIAVRCAGGRPTPSITSSRRLGVGTSGQGICGRCVVGVIEPRLSMSPRLGRRMAGVTLLEQGKMIEDFLTVWR